jgi:hypothetical protein
MTAALGREAGRPAGLAGLGRRIRELLGRWAKIRQVAKFSGLTLELARRAGAPAGYVRELHRTGVR